MYRIMIAALCAIGAIGAAVAGDVVLEGQFTCSECWFEADRSQVPYGSKSDIACAARCASAGVPPAFATRDENGFELLLLEGSERDWPEWVGKYARIEGTTRDEGDRRLLTVSEVEPLSESPWSIAEPEAIDAPLAWRDLSGHGQTIEQYRGRIVLLNFWATWCAPCRKEMPDLIRLQNKFGMYGVQVVAVSADDEDQVSRVAEFARKHKLNFPVLMGADSAQMQTLGLGMVLPATAILDRDGNVVDRIFGIVDRKQVEETLDLMVREAPGSEGAGDHHQGHGDAVDRSDRGHDGDDRGDGTQGHDDHVEESAAARHSDDEQPGPVRIAQAKPAGGASLVPS